MMSGLLGSTVTPLKYHERSRMRGSSPMRCHVLPPSSERYSPPVSFSSMSAYTRLTPLPLPVASPTRPQVPPGSPWPVSCVHVAPPSVDLYIPLPAPSNGG